jgi:hypothetical protein
MKLLDKLWTNQGVVLAGSVIHSLPKPAKVTCPELVDPEIVICINGLC